ncbi:MAG: hypothetical protein MRJ65_04120 [Candidatus Brocadiaceae bacterium]|nr:hypothetical protein [Candidatus Brocadiaceae bacterium]
MRSLGLLKNYALNLVNGKIQKYEVEKSCFEKKYGQSLEDFRRKLDAMENEENFEWEDDLNDWEFAVENLKYWKRKASELQNGSKRLGYVMVFTSSNTITERECFWILCHLNSLFLSLFHLPAC